MCTDGLVEVRGEDIGVGLLADALCSPPPTRLRPWTTPAT